jgi:hypothetical protein
VFVKRTVGEWATGMRAHAVNCEDLSSSVADSVALSVVQDFHHLA